MVNPVWVNADHGRDFQPLADHMKKLRHFTKEENLDFSAFCFFTSVNACTSINFLKLSDFTKSTYKSCTNKLARCSGYYVGLVFRKINLK